MRHYLLGTALTLTMTAALPAFADEAGDAPATAGAIEPGVAVEGAIDVARDSDWFAVELSAGERYTIDLQGAASGAGTLSDHVLRVFDAEGVQLAVNDDGGEGFDSRLVFTPEADGIHHIVAGAFGGITGTYRLTLTAGEGVAGDADIATRPSDPPAEEETSGGVLTGSADDYPAGPATTGAVEIGGSVSGVIETAGDRDWFRVEIEAGESYVFDLRGASGGDGDLGDPVLVLLDPNGAEIARDDDGGQGLDSRLFFEAPSDGVHYLAAQGWGQNTGSYTLAAETVAPVDDDYPADPSTSGRLAIGGAVTGEIETPGDADWFMIELRAGQPVQLDLEGTTLSDPVLVLYDSSGAEVAYNDDSPLGLDSRLSFNPPQDGIYYASAGAYGTNTGGYTLSAAALPEDLVGDTPQTAGRIAVGETVEGQLVYEGDRDWYALELTGGAGVVIHLESSQTNPNPMGDPVVAIFDQSGMEIAYDDDGGADYNSRLVFAAPSDGVYYVSAEGYWADDVGAYTLRVEPGASAAPVGKGEGQFDDYPADATTTGFVAAPGARTGIIEAAGDVDWIGFDLAAGQTVQIDVRGAHSGVGTLSDPTLEIVSQWGDRLAYNDDGGEGFESRITFTAPSAGRYYAAIAAWSTGTGSYELTLGAPQTQPPRKGEPVIDDYPSHGSTQGYLGIGQSARGVIDFPGDVDWIAIDLFAGQVVQIDLQGADTGLGTLADPYLEVLDQYGALVAQDDDGGEGWNSRLIFTAPADARYFLAVQSYSDGLGTYEISAQPAMRK